MCPKTKLVARKIDHEDKVAVPMLASMSRAVPSLLQLQNLKRLSIDV